MVRPTGVTILAILDFLGAAICVLFGLGLIAGGGFIATLINQQGGQGSAGAAGALAGLGAVMGIGLLVGAAINILLGVGLWKLKEWARITTVILVGIGAAFQVLGLFLSLAHFVLFSFLITVVVLAIQAFVIFYLLKPEVKAAFQPPMARAATA